MVVKDVTARLKKKVVQRWHNLQERSDNDFIVHEFLFATFSFCEIWSVASLFARRCRRSRDTVRPVFVQPVFVQSFSSNPIRLVYVKIGRNGLDENRFDQNELDKSRSTE